MSADGQKKRQITSGPGSKGPDAWLPDGRIVYEVWTSGADAPQWFVMNGDGSNPQAIGQLDALRVAGPIDWLPAAGE